MVMSLRKPSGWLVRTAKRRRRHLYPSKAGKACSSLMAVKRLAKMTPRPSIA